MAWSKKRLLAMVFTVGLVPAALSGCESCNPWWSAAGGALVAAGIAKAAGADTETTVIAGVAGGAIGYIVCQASLEEQRQAELEAARAREKMQQDEIERLRRENRVVLAKVGDKEYVPVDENGKASDKKIYFERDPIEEQEATTPTSPSSPPTSTDPAAGAPTGAGTESEVKTAEADNIKLEGMKSKDGSDTFNVIFVDAG